MDTPLIVQTTVETKQNGQNLANILLEKRLVACAQLSGPIESRYWWRDVIEQAEEYILTVKTFSSMYDRVETAIRTNHSYEVPEIIAIKMAKVSDSYLDWLKRELAP